MFDISLGETFIVIGISATLIGRRDLPKASHFLGQQVGRIVGFLQGARARADRFAVDNELSALQNELRSGLRELDTVKSELAVAASSRGMVGRGLMMAPPNKTGSTGQQIPSQSKAQSSTTTMGTARDPSILSGSDYLKAARNYEASSSSSSSSSPSPYAGMLSQLAPRAQSVAAVAEEEWEKQGIGFKSRAEMGNGSVGPAMGTSGGNIGGGRDVGGSTLLANLIQQNLIHDQYDRAVMDQDRELKEKMDRRRKERENNNDVLEEKKD